MLIKYYVAQENEKGEKRNKFLFQEDRTLLFAGMVVKFKRLSYQIMYFQLFHAYVDVVCHELKIKNEKNEKITTSGDSEDIGSFEQ